PITFSTVPRCRRKRDRKRMKAPEKPAAIQKGMGLFLVLTGLAFLFGWVRNVAIWFQQTFPILMKIG
ncbi:hypothetical protein ACC848_39220, partial [Rhizobium johnstonii]